MARKRVIDHHLVRREDRLGSGKAIDGTVLIPATSLPEGHVPAKIRASRRNGVIEGKGLVYRQPREGMMVEAVSFQEKQR